MKPAIWLGLKPALRRLSGWRVGCVGCLGLCLWLAGVSPGIAQTAPLVPLAPRSDAAAGLPGSDPAFAAPPGSSEVPADAADPNSDPNSSESGQRPNQRLAREAALAAPQRSSKTSPPTSGNRAASESSTSSSGASAAPPSESTPPGLPPLPPLPPLLDLAPPSVQVPWPSYRHGGSAAPTSPVKLPDPDARITLALSQVDLAVALKAFAEFTGLNIIASDHVRGSVSLSLTRVPWRRAFDTLLDANGLAMQQHDNLIWVAPASEIAAREKQRFEANARITELEPLASRMFVLQYQRADDVRKLLAGGGNQQVLSKRGTAMADPRTDHLFVTDLPERIAQVAALIAAIDVPPRQVLIESRIVEADESFERNLGARLALIDGHPAPDDRDPHGIHGGPAGNLYDLPAGGIGGYPAATLGITLFSAGDSRELMLELSALEAEGHGRIISSPRVVTADRVRALIEQGTELPYQAKVDTGVSAVQFRRAGLKLEVIPHITPDHHVMLDVDVTKDSVGAETTAGPAIDTKHVQTQVQVENGGTVAIGGIYLENERRDATRVPWLGSLPLVGFLFRRTAISHSKDELMIFITPTEVGPLDRLAASRSAGATPDSPAGTVFMPPSGKTSAAGEANAPASSAHALASAEDGVAPPEPVVPAIPQLPASGGDPLGVKEPQAELGATRDTL